VRYTITFLDYWHLSSGLSAGARLDSSVVKDNDGIAYVPGKTIKGLLREMAELIDSEFASKSFGEEETQQGVCFFSNASLDESTKKEIIENNLQSHLYDELTSTSISDNGIVKKGSLREIEVVVPLTLYGSIEHCEDKEKMIKAMKMVKRMGLNRNRGLGRCRFDVIGDTK
jgi:CRISPR/Cas system CSM-associated protein Csm3 (group 7 of RAMP superfamily)